MMCSVSVQKTDVNDTGLASVSLLEEWCDEGQLLVRWYRSLVGG